MGGNAKAVYRSTGTVKIYDDRLAYAEKIFFDEVLPDEFVENVEELLRRINSKIVVWSESSVKAGTIFFGSFYTLKSLVDRTAFAKVKSHLGDIDVAVPMQKMNVLHELLLEFEEKELTSKFVYIGQNRQKFSGKKLNCIFYYLPAKKFVQIDFEGMDFASNAPEEYVRFMRSSPWIDLQEEIKGLAHKYLIASIARVVSYKPNIVILTNKSPLYPAKDVRIKSLDEIPHSLVFSKEGLRDKLEQQFRMGFPVMIEGKYAYKELSKERSHFETDLKKIFKKLFKKDPDQQDMQDFESYKGTLNLCSRLFSRNKIEEIYQHLIEVKLWGTGQALSRDSADDDKKIKEVIIYTMESKFPYLVGNLPLEQIMQEYYEKYEVREEDNE